MADLLSEVEELRRRAQEARNRGAKSAAAAELLRAELAQLAESLGAQGIETWDQAEERLAVLRTEAEQATEAARAAMDREGF